MDQPAARAGVDRTGPVARGGALALTFAVALTLSGCGDDGGSSVAVPDGATFCSFFNEEYLPVLNSPVAPTEDGFVEHQQELVDGAEVLAALAPDELADEAADNVEYHRAGRDGESVADHVDGSNAFFAYGLDECG